MQRPAPAAGTRSAADHVAHCAAARIAAARPLQSYMVVALVVAVPWEPPDPLVALVLVGTVTFLHALATVVKADWLPLRESPPMPPKPARRSR